MAAAQAANRQPGVEGLQDTALRSRARGISIGLLAFALLVGYSTRFAHPAWSIRAAIVVGAVPIGLGFLALRAAKRDLVALAGGAFLLAAAISGAASRAPGVAFVGLPGWSTGWVHWAGTVALLFLGSAVPRPQRNMVCSAIVLGASVNAGAALLQFAPAPPAFVPQVFDGRAVGLLGNAVHLGTACAMGLAALPGVGRRGLPVLLCAALLGAGLQLSGSRIAMALAIVAILATGRRAWRDTGVRLAAVAAGMAIASGLAAVSAPFVPAGTATARAATTSQSASGRVGNWEAGLTAWADDPATGVGTGRFVVASARHRTRATVAAEDALFYDAHNVGVELLATTGLLGTLAMVALLVMVVRAASWGVPCVIALVGFGATLLQPQFAGTTPIAAIAAGLCLPERTWLAGSTRAWRGVGATLAAIGLAVAGALLFGERQLAQAVRIGDAEAAGRAAALMPWRPDVELARSGLESSPLSARLRAARRATEMDPDHAAAWNQLGGLLIEAGDEGAARGAFGRALSTDPWNNSALRALARLEAKRGHARTSAALCERLHSVRPTVRCLR